MVRREATRAVEWEGVEVAERREVVREAAAVWEAARAAAAAQEAVKAEAERKAGAVEARAVGRAEGGSSLPLELEEWEGAGPEAAARAAAARAAAAWAAVARAAVARAAAAWDAAGWLEVVDGNPPSERAGGAAEAGSHRGVPAEVAAGESNRRGGREGGEGEERNQQEGLAGEEEAGEPAATAAR